MTPVVGMAESSQRRRLQGILPPGSPSILEAVSVERRGRELFHLMSVHDLEGIVAKRLSDPYEHPRQVRFARALRRLSFVWLR
jgi:ATP-dependent DNA ligase